MTSRTLSVRINERMEADNYWRGIVHSGVLRSNTVWYERGRVGSGQLVAEGRDLRGISRIRDLRGARFVRCDMTHVALGRAFLNDVELIGCVLVDGGITESTLDHARIE